MPVQSPSDASGSYDPAVSLLRQDKVTPDNLVTLEVLDDETIVSALKGR